jgi:alanine racemase
MSRPAEARIDLGAARANYAELSRAAAGAQVIAVVKADAYGHGAPAIAAALAAEGCGRFAVVTLEEAALLREAGRSERILVLGGVHDTRDALEALALDLTPVIHRPDDVALLAEAAAGEERPLEVQVEIDTGMRRMGVAEEEAVAVLRAVAAEPALRLEGVYTHPARADEDDLEPTRRQLALFARLLQESGVEPGIVHWSNSAVTLLGAELKAPMAPDAVRPGLALYGAQPAVSRRSALRPVMTLVTQVVHARAVRAGDTVGYGGTWRAQRDTRIATLPLGYADGMPRAAGGVDSRAEVAIGGRRFRVVGRVSMDFTTVEVGDAPVAVGDEVRVFGAGEATPAVEELADAAGTLAYEILVGVGPRVPRVAVDAWDGGS